MYTSLPQITRGWSRILFDALGWNPWKVAWLGLDPLLFSHPAHVALVASLALGRAPGPFAPTILAMSVLHHVLAYTCLRRLYLLSAPRTRHVA